MEDPEEMKTQCFGGEYMGEVSVKAKAVVIVTITATYCTFDSNN